MSAIGTLPGMGRKKLPAESPSAKKPSGGKNVTPRTPVQIPDAWLLVARKLAQRAPQPTVWYLISLIQKDAIAAGVSDLPKPPWERDDIEADRG